jgi:hypothetical protein
MKVQIDYDELWPWFTMESGYGITVDVPEETVEQWRRASKEFFKCQEEMRKLSQYGT